MMGTSGRGHIARALLTLGVMIVGTVVVVEGISSLVMFGYAVSGRGLPEEVPTERGWTKYDPLLGWVSIANLHEEDMFGRGGFVRTNAQGFRKARSIGVQVPPGKIRVICSGDSFTFGISVDDDHTWCELLASRDPRIEPVNMGQGGYGIDQAYLWYKRDGNVLQHDVLIFAFTTDDFYRMESPTYFGYGKPILNIKNERLVVENLPVPRRKWYLPRSTLDTARMIEAVRQLKSYEVAMRVRRRLTGYDVGEDHSIHDHTWDVTLKVFESLQEMCDAKKSALVLVYLPAAKDTLTWMSQKSYWRDRLTAESKKRNWVYVDLMPELRRLPAEQSETFFAQGAGHYSEAGNQWVADRLDRLIEALPQFVR